MRKSVDFVWNYCNEVSIRSITYNNKWLSNYDLHKLTSGCFNELGILAQTIQSVCNEYVNKRNHVKKVKLAWRSEKRSLGWIPLKEYAIIKGDAIIYRKLKFRFWKSQNIDGVFKVGSFSQDARGRWYINITCEVTKPERVTTGNHVGIDLGLKATATYSYGGGKLQGGKHYRNLESKLATAQRANKKRLVKSIHAKIANSRKDELHKETSRLVRQYDSIFVGNVSSKKLVKTKMAKSVLDAGWGQFRSMLAYKAIALGVEYAEVNESFSTVTCSNCFERTGPSGLSALGVRSWVCKSCGKTHDRDENSANNILMVGLGHQTLIKGNRVAVDVNAQE